MNCTSIFSCKMAMVFYISPISTFIFKFFSVQVTYFFTFVWSLSCSKYLFYAFNYFLQLISENITKIYLRSLHLYKTFLTRNSSEANLTKIYVYWLPSYKNFYVYFQNYLIFWMKTQNWHMWRHFIMIIYLYIAVPIFSLINTIWQ